MTTDTPSKINENTKKKKQIQHSDESKQSKKESDRQSGHCLDLREVWSRNYRLSPVGVAKETETLVDITTLTKKSLYLSCIQLIFFGMTCSKNIVGACKPCDSRNIN